VRAALCVAAIAIVLNLAACGKPLGTYKIRDIRVVPGSAFKIVEPDADADPEMLHIEFASKTDMHEAAGNADLYVFTSFCPFQDKSPISVSEPYFNDRPNFDPVTSKYRRPMKDASGEYVYTTYLRLQGSASLNRGDGRLSSTGYDLRRQRADLCLRIEHPEYSITPSQSRIFVVPAALLQRALMDPPAAAHA